MIFGTDKPRYRIIIWQIIENIDKIDNRLIDLGIVYSFSRYLKFPGVFVKRVSFRVSKLTNRPYSTAIMNKLLRDLHVT